VVMIVPRCDANKQCSLPCSHELPCNLHGAENLNVQRLEVIPAWIDRGVFVLHIFALPGKGLGRVLFSGARALLCFHGTLR
jgi:hypothetical protein